MTEKNTTSAASTSPLNDGLGWMTRTQPFRLADYLNFGSFMNGFGPYQAFVTYTHRLFTTIARLPFPAQEKTDKEVQRCAQISTYRNYDSRIV